MTEEISVEDKARAQGWVPKDEYYGPEDNWKSAEEFVEVGEKISAIQAERNEKLLGEISELKRDMQEWNRIREQEIKAVREASYNKAIKELQEKQIEAVEEGDVDKFKDIQQEMNRIQKPVEKPAPKQPEPVTPPPEYIDWAARNAWYGKDQEMTKYADFIGQEMAGEFSDPVKFYNAVTQKVKKVFPDNFSGSTSSTPDVESPNGSVSVKSKGKHKFNDMPKEAQTACDKFIKQGLYKTREDYMKVFYGEE